MHFKSILNKNLLLLHVLFFILIICDSILQAKPGIVIAFSGLSGCGKSTMAHILAKELKVACISEPEENQWPELIKNRHIYGTATALLAFRQIWAQLFLDAHRSAQKNDIVFIDTYFFKIFGYYLDAPGMQWLIEKDNPYLPLLKQLNQHDQELFPDADYVILFDTTIEDWKLFLKSRGRKWDAIPDFIQSSHLTQKYIQEATLTHCKKHSIPVIRFQQQFGDPYKQALILKQLLLSHNIINMD